MKAQPSDQILDLRAMLRRGRLVAKNPWRCRIKPGATGVSYGLLAEKFSFPAIHRQSLTYGIGFKSATLEMHENQ